MKFKGSENRKRFYVLLIGIGLLSLPVLVDVLLLQYVKHPATRIKVGDSKGDVLKSLGKPITKFGRGSGNGPVTGDVIGVAIFGEWSNGPESWVYGRKFRLKGAFSKEPPFFNPIRFRMFSPDDDDLIIKFDEIGKVSEVIIPK